MGFQDESDYVYMNEEDDLLIRYYMEVYSDAGAITDFDEMHDITSSFSNVVCWLGGWHIEKNFMEGIMKILKVHDMGGLIDIWGWTGPVAHRTLYACGTKRKTKSFLLDGLIPSMYNAMFYHYAVYMDEEGEDDVSIEGFESYIDDGLDETDETFSNYALILDMLMALKLLLLADVPNNMSMFDAGRMFLLPLNFSLNNSTYGPAHVKEVVQLYHRMKPEAREDHARFFTYGGKPYDERMEEHNQAQKRLMSDRAPTEKRVKITGLFVEKVNTLSKHLSAILNVKQRAYRARTHKDHEETVIKMTRYIVNSGILKKVPGRQGVCDFRGSHHVNSERTASAIMIYGIEQEQIYFGEYLKGNRRIPWPEPIALVDGVVEEAENDEAELSS
jgi:hypothetical protein